MKLPSFTSSRLPIVLVAVTVACTQPDSPVEPADKVAVLRATLAHVASSHEHGPVLLETRLVQSDGIVETGDALPSGWLSSLSRDTSMVKICDSTCLRDVRWSGDLVRVALPVFLAAGRASVLVRLVHWYPDSVFRGMGEILTMDYQLSRGDHGWEVVSADNVAAGTIADSLEQARNAELARP